MCGMAAKSKKAYSYIRFSTPEQAKGDSKRRQMERSAEYAKEKGWDLDESIDLKDLGVSAFRGKNRATGALAKFLDLITEGRIEKGSVLIVESLDRLSRENVLTAQKTFLGILEEGIAIVTLIDKRHYTLESVSKNSMELIASILVFERANEESRTKSDRKKKSWEKIRENKEIKFTRRCPAWLELSDDRKKFIQLKDRCELIKRIFEMSAEGMGKALIASTLNHEMVPSWRDGKRGGNGWYPSYISKILSSRSVIGEFQPHEMVEGKRKPIGEALPNYFPSIISNALYQSAQQSIESRKGKGGRKSKLVNNLFSHIAVCGYCGASLTFVTKGQGSTYLVCSAARRRWGCRYISWRYEEFEASFLDLVSELDFSKLASPPQHHTNKLNETRNELSFQLNENIKKQKQLAEKLVEETEPTPKAVIKLLRALEIEEEAIKEKAKIVQGKISNIEQDRKALTIDKRALLEQISRKGEPAIRRRLAREIERRTIQIAVYPAGWPDSENLISRHSEEFEVWIASIKNHRHISHPRFYIVAFRDQSVRIVAPETETNFSTDFYHPDDLLAPELFDSPDDTLIKDSELETVLIKEAQQMFYLEIVNSISD